MRFYVGLSHRINILSLLKWVGLIIGGILAFFGIFNINANALTSTQAPSAVKRCSYNGLFTDSNCINETPYNCTLSGLSSPFSCYVPDSSNNNIKLDTKSIWYSYTSNTTGNCNTSQTISFNVDVILNDQLSQNGYSSPTASDGPFVAEALNYNAWNNVNPTTRGGLTKAASSGFMNLYWKYLDNANSKNKTGLKIYAYSSSTGYQMGSCQFVSYGSNKSVRFLCSAPAKMSTYYVGQNIYNNGGGLGTSSTYARNAQYISNVSDPCVSSSSTDMSGVTSAINNQTSSIMSGFSDVIENQNSNNQEVVDGLQGIQDKQDSTNDKLDIINDTLTDSSVDTSDTIDFFNDNNVDRHGVGSILTAPIRLYQALIDSSVDYDGTFEDPTTRGLTKDGGSGGGTGFSCDPLSVRFNFINNGTIIDIPCGSIFWDNVDSNFIRIYNIAVWGLLAFSVCKMFVKMVHRVMDPDYKNEMDDLTASKDL